MGKANHVSWARWKISRRGHHKIANLSFSKVSELFFWNATSNFSKSKVTEGTKYPHQLVDTHQQQILGAQLCVVMWESDTERDMRVRQRERGENVERNSEFMTLVLHTICSQVGRCSEKASPLRVSEFALLPLRLETAGASCHAGAGHSFFFCACGPLMIRVLLLYSTFEHIQTFPLKFCFFLWRPCLH
jgi:hypothetical protein